MLEEGVASALIDAAMRHYGFEWKPSMMDLIGNDELRRNGDRLGQFFYDPRFKPSLTQNA